MLRDELPDTLMCASDSFATYGRRYTYLSIYLSLFVQQKDSLNAIGHAVGQDSETKSTEHCPKYKQSTVI